MRLDPLLSALPVLLWRIGGDAEIGAIRADSRQVRPGDLFVAIPGVSVDGHTFIAQAIEEGAVAVVGERAPQEMPDLPWGSFAYARVPDARQAWGWLCAAWEGLPSRRLTLVGVTGTDGKTTTVTLIHAILQAAGLNAGLVSTVSARIGGEEVDTGLHTTTPDPPDLQRYLARMVASGATHGVLEVTSHGLAQQRVAGCDFDVAVVTNITHEHLDFHGSLEAYRQAKMRLFQDLMPSARKPGVPKVAVLNRDDGSYEYLRPIPADRQITYSLEGPADVTATGIHTAPDATRFSLRLPDGETPVETRLVGLFNVSNILAAAAVAVALDIPPSAIASGVAAVHGVPGRMERVDAGQDFLALVDFAHTPTSLRRALEVARTMARGRVIVVFGCAGLRDREKRPLMGRIAAELADVVVITAEDPRTERLEEIMAVSAAAAQEAGRRQGVDLFLEPDRGEALLLACRMARPDDVVIACGKGHEQSMCFGTVEYPWDDREALRRALRGETLDTLPTARHATV
jgi:UDP-N-acetylmuramoyl-L-alanyl-D-glutamate--2,6-diaminopimelate ligase